MNIKAKLIEQLKVLENIQLLATESGAFDTALETSKVIMDYIILIDAAEDEEECPGCGCDELFICPDCEEVEMKATLITDIANEAGVSTLIVKMVLDAQSVVLEID